MRRIPPLAQFPGQQAAAKSLDNSRGLAARYTTVISSHLVNVLGYGYTRLGAASTGNDTVVPSFFFANLRPRRAPRSASRPPPTSWTT